MRKFIPRYFTHFIVILSFLAYGLPTALSSEINSLVPPSHVSDSWFDYRVMFYLVICLFTFFLMLSIYLKCRIQKKLLRDNKSKRKTEKSLRVSNQRLASYKENTPLGVIDIDTDLRITAWNLAAQKIFGYPCDEAIGKHVLPLIFSADIHEQASNVCHKLMESKERSISTNENITQGRGVIVCEWYCTPLLDEQDDVVGITSLVNDITERKVSEEMIWRQANFDRLTGLPNRNMFRDSLNQEIIRAERKSTLLAVFLLDLDQFKEVNDTLGHDYGDLLLKECSSRIKECIRKSDTICRIGGDEFVIILPELNNKNDIEFISQKIIDRLEGLYHIRDETVHISTSMGITLFPVDGPNIDTLIKNADQAMYEAKKAGGNRYCYFTQALHDAAQSRLKLANDLRSAIHEEQFEVYFQPIIDLKTDQIIKAEALIRWNHPVKGLIGPDQFIHLSEELGLINDIGNWVFKQAAITIKRWAQEVNCDFQISVNVSPVQFKVPTLLFIEQWSSLLSELGIDGCNLVMEITEGLLLGAEELVIDKLLWLRDVGIQVAIDDFGTGYSSLSYLRRFDIDYLKIDRSFISSLEDNINDVILCDAIIAMAHTLGLKIIAEGVETQGQKKILLERGCDYAQGYLFSKPIGLHEFEKLIKVEIINKVN